MKNHYLSKKWPAKCPRCGNKAVARILWGLPIMSDKLKRDLNEGAVILGGCCQETEAPSWQCTECNTYIHKEIKGDGVI